MEKAIYHLQFHNWTINIEKKKTQISLGPYYPWRNYEIDHINNPKINYPAFSDIVFNSKTGPLLKASNYIKMGRREQLKIVSNFYANYIKTANIPLNCDRIIPIPAKPKYSFNSIEIICKEISNIFKIPIDNKIIRRTSDIEKSYEIDRSINFSNSKLLLIDDIITKGDTKEIICSKLNEIGCQNFCIITLGKTDHNIYEYL